jgi:hypothetical protein
MCQDVADQCRGRNVIAVNDTYKLHPWADVLYCGDGEWWHVHKGAPEFEGERWAAYNDKYRPEEMRKAAELYDIKLIYAMYGDGFSPKPDTLHYGANSGYAAVNLALHFGCKTIVLTGFDMRYIDGKCHWFGLHAFGSNPKSDFTDWLTRFEGAAATVPDDVRIVNATPGSALRCFEMMDLKDALELID